VSLIARFQATEFGFTQHQTPITTTNALLLSTAGLQFECLAAVKLYSQLASTDAFIVMNGKEIVQISLSIRSTEIVLKIASFATALKPFRQHFHQ